MTVDSIYHGVFIKVYVNGTEAATATAEVSVMIETI
jgi:serine protease inhibitor